MSPYCPYKILELEKNASFEEVKQAFKQLAKLHHPDAGGDAEMFKKISNAYDMLIKDWKEDNNNNTNDGTSSEDLKSKQDDRTKERKKTVKLNYKYKFVDDKEISFIYAIPDFSPVLLGRGEWNIYQCSNNSNNNSDLLVAKCYFGSTHCSTRYVERFLIVLSILTNYEQGKDMPSLYRYEFPGYYEYREDGYIEQEPDLLSQMPVQLDNLSA